MDKKGEDITGYYIQPSFSRMVITLAGNICDFAGANNLGLWDPATMKNINLITGLQSQDSQSYVKPIPGGQGNRVVFYSADKFQILDMDNKKNPTVWEKVQVTDDIQQVAINSSNGRELYVLLTSGFLNIWDLEEKKIIKQFQTIKKMYRRMQVFPDGKNIALQDKLGLEINIMERATGIETKLAFKSPASRFIILNNTELAIVFKNHIQILSITKGLHNIQANFICEDPDEVLESVAVINNNQWLVAAGEKGILRIWNLQTQKLIHRLDGNQFNNAKSLQKLTHVHSILQLPSLNSIGLLNSEERRFRIFHIGDFEHPEFSKTFQFSKELVSTINTYEMAFSLNGNNLIGLFSVKGTFTEEEVIFTKEIEIVDLYTNKLLASKDLSHAGFTLEQSTMRTNGKNKLFYLMKSDVTGESIFVEFNVAKYLELNEDQRKDSDNNRSLYEVVTPFAVQNNGQYAIFSPVQSQIDRIIVPFSTVVPQLSNFGIKDTSGIAVYDYQIKQLWQHQFEEVQTIKFAAMVDERTIAFINKNNWLEIYDIVDNKMLSHTEIGEKCEISKFIYNQYQFLILDPQNHLRVFEHDTGDQVDYIKLHQSVKQIQPVGKDSCLILSFDDSLQKVNLDDVALQQCNSKRSITNFIVLPNEDKQNQPLILLLSEEYFEIRDFISI